MAKVYETGQTVFSTKDLALLWGKTDPIALKDQIAYRIKQKDLIRITRGVFTKRKDFNPRELATSLYAPSYISFETALRDAGMIFQYFETISVAAPWSITKTIGEQRFIFRKLKDNILFNPTGVEYRDYYSIATPERAFLDMIYLSPNYYFDNLRPINWEKCWELAPIYQNSQLNKRLGYYQKKYAEQT